MNATLNAYVMANLLLKNTYKLFSTDLTTTTFMDILYFTKKVESELNKQYKQINKKSANLKFFLPLITEDTLRSHEAETASRKKTAKDNYFPVTIHVLGDPVYIQQRNSIPDFDSVVRTDLMKLKSTLPKEVPPDYIYQIIFTNAYRPSTNQINYMFNECVDSIIKELKIIGFKLSKNDQTNREEIIKIIRKVLASSEIRTLTKDNLKYKEEDYLHYQITGKKKPRWDDKGRSSGFGDIEENIEYSENEYTI